MPSVTSSELQALRAQLSRAEKAARKAAKTPPTASAARPLPPQREHELEGVSTREFALGRAHARLREAVLSGQYQLCAHAIQHARAEGFLEADVTQVLQSGRVRAVYPEDKRWLVAGYFEAQRIRLPLHVVVEVKEARTPFGTTEFLDVVTAFIPKNPHHIISRARLAVMLRYDERGVQHRFAQAGNKVGYKGKGKWKGS